MLVRGWFHLVAVGSLSLQCNSLCEDLKSPEASSRHQDVAKNWVFCEKTSFILPFLFASIPFFLFSFFKKKKHQPFFLPAARFNFFPHKLFFHTVRLGFRATVRQKFWNGWIWPPTEKNHQSIRWNKTRWWFQIFFIFTPTWGNDPIWLIFFKGVETTNYLWVLEVQKPPAFQAVKDSELFCWGAMVWPKRKFPFSPSCLFAVHWFVDSEVRELDLVGTRLNFELVPLVAIVGELTWLGPVKLIQT